MTRLKSAVGIALLLTGAPVCAEAADYEGPGFSGDAFVSNDGAPLQRAGTVHIGPAGFRMNMVADGRRIASLVPWSGDLAYSLFLDEMVYLEMPAEQVGIEPYENRPCVGYRDGESLGVETFDGRPVEKWRCTGEISPALGRSPVDATTLYDPELAFEIRVERDGGEILEVRNVRVGSQDPSLFEIPEGFRKLDMQALMKQMMEQQQGQ